MGDRVGRTLVLLEPRPTVNLEQYTLTVSLILGGGAVLGKQRVSVDIMITEACERMYGLGGDVCPADSVTKMVITYIKFSDWRDIYCPLLSS